jgi:hypothetical protein
VDDPPIVESRRRSLPRDSPLKRSTDRLTIEYMEWVGTGRTAELCLPIPPVATVHATFTAHGDRLRGFTVLSALLTSARIPKP